MTIKQPVLKDINLLSIILRLIKSHNGHYGPWFDVITGADLGGGGGGSFDVHGTPDTLDASVIPFSTSQGSKGSLSHFRLCTQEP